MGASLFWGVGDYLLALVTRRLGVLRTLLLASGLSTLTIFGLFIITGSSLPTHRSDWVVLIVLSLVGSGAFTLIATALKAGPVSIVSPIIAAAASVIVVLALVIHGEELSTLESLGVLGAIFGVVLTSIDLRAPVHAGVAEAVVLIPKLGAEEFSGVGETPGADALKGGSDVPLRRKLGKGPALAIIASVTIGVVTFYSGVYAQRLGWVIPALVGRVTLLAVYVGGVAVSRASFKGVPFRMIVFGSFVGLIEAGGFLSFSRGAEVGLISIVAAVSAMAPLFTLVLGVWFLGERPAPNQLLGASIVIASLVVLGLGG